VHTGFGEGRRPEGKRTHGYLGVDGRIISIMDRQKRDGKAWTGLIWLRVGAGGGLL
jgi:hypothetical protein